MKIRHARAILIAAMFCLAAANPASAQLWKLSSITPAPWVSVASSADGTRLAAAGPGLLYTSTNSGVTWTSNSAPFTNWSGIASSADGSKLVAVVAGFGIGSGGVYTNSGTNWALSPLGAGVAPGLSCVASSADGKHFVVAGAQIITGVIYYSTNSGSSWTKATGNYSLSSMAYAGNTPIVYAAGNTVVISTNAGATWSGLNNPPPINRIVCSTNGLVLAGLTTNLPAPIYTSVDGGQSWTTNTLAQPSPWTSLACSADGIKLVAGTSDGGIYSSPDSGAHWIRGTAPGLPWTSVASSADGTNLVATAPGYIFTGRVPLPTLGLGVPGTNFSISWTTNAAGYNLYLLGSTNASGSPATIFFSPVITNDVFRITVPATNSQMFFWLGIVA